MTLDLENSILSTVLQSIIRTLIVSVIAFSGLALTEHVPSTPLVSELSAPLLILPYILYELLATLWSHAEELVRRLLALGAISAMGVWIYLFRRVGIVSLGIVLVITIVIDLVPVKNILDSLFSYIYKNLSENKEAFESNTFSPDNTDTRLFPLEKKEGDKSSLENSSDSTCPDCGNELDRLLVGRYCPHCGNILNRKEKK